LVLAVIGAGGVFIYIDHRRAIMKKEQGV